MTLQEGTQENQEKPQAHGLALIPIIVFLVIYLGAGIYFEFINPTKGQKGFYVMSVVVSFFIALIVALLQTRGHSFDEKIRLCARGIGDENIAVMIFIFIAAGCFSGVAQAAGGAESTANMLLTILPGRFALPGLFLIACLISMAMGTSVGTITVLAPIAVNLAQHAQLSIPLSVATVVSGAMFGDNLSFISDTTIAATKTQGVAMIDKFMTNFKVALPAALGTFAILVVLSFQSSQSVDLHYDFNFWQVVPYIAVLVASLCRFNVFGVLCGGVVLFSLVGLATHSLNAISMLSALKDGTAGMNETIIVAILVAAIGSLIKHNGGFAWIVEKIKTHFNGRRGGSLGIGLLTLFMDIATANNTVAIVMAAPIARDISKEFNIEPRQVASLLDTFSCIGQGIIPYGAQLLIAASIANISAVSIIPFLFYQFLLLVCVIASIVVMSKPRTQAVRNKQ
ncbi:Na+/H+ antiporter NhaC family protein [Alloscardovia omnicolens]|uniref:Na+/H+ antiporter NhaC family protein n=1 Tax=Alloscardovia omnicolens TaxID=419015 RepID=UPI003A709ADD